MNNCKIIPYPISESLLEIRQSLLQARQQLTTIIFCLLIVYSQNNQAHEFWLEPYQYQLDESSDIEIMFLVGEMFQGMELPYLSHQTEQLELSIAGSSRLISSMEGDIPAVKLQTTESGLYQVYYRSGSQIVSYHNWDEFLRFLEYEGLQPYAALHRARGLSLQNFKERYYRHAKTLIQVGKIVTTEMSQNARLPYEMQLSENPYQPGLERLEIQLLQDGQMLENQQIAIFEYKNSVKRRLKTTDLHGKIRLEIQPGSVYLLNSVVIKAVERSEFVWETHWVSLTFATPEME